MRTVRQKILQGHQLWLAGLIALLAFVLYANTLGHDFAWDDAIVITQNERVQEGISGIPDLFFNYRSDALQDSYGYRPLTLMVFALEWSLFGADPGGFHLVNVLLFSLLCGGIFLTLVKAFPKANPWLFFLTALLFAVHPLHVEAVANIKSLDEILALSFSMLALYAFVEYLDRGKWLALLACLAAMGAAFLSKEGALTFVGVFPLVALLRTDQKLGSLLRRAALPVLALVVLGSGIYFLSRSSAWVVEEQGQEQMDLYHEDPMLANPLFGGHTTAESVGTGMMVLGHYYKNFLLPYPLRYYSGYRQFPVSGPFEPWALLGWGLSLALLALGIVFWRKRPVLTFGVGYWWVTILLYTHWLRPLPDLLADRFVFTPSLGLCLLAAYGLLVLLRFDPRRTQPLPEILPKLSPLKWSLPLILLSLAALTFSRNTAWKNNLSLFERDIPHLENCARAHYLLANELSFRYADAPKQAELKQRIIHHYKRSIEISDRSFYSFIKLGRMYMVFGDYPAAYQLLEEAIQKYPKRSRPYFHKAYGHFAEQSYDQSLPLIEEAVRLAPGRQDAYYYLAWSQFKTGNPDGGVLALEKAQDLFPQSGQFWDYLSDMLFEKGDSSRGLKELEHLVRNFPVEGPAWQKLLARYQQMGLQSKADQLYQEGRFKGYFR